MKKHNNRGIEADIVLHEYSEAETVELYTRFTEQIGILNVEECLVKKYCPNKESRILVVGCGAGRTISGLSRIGYNNIKGIDLSQKMIERCREFGFNCQLFDVDFLSFNSNNTYHLITFWFNGLMINPSYERRKKCVDKAASLLEKNGRIVISCPVLPDDYDWDEEKEKVQRVYNNQYIAEPGDRVYSDRYFIHFPVKNELCNLLGKFRVIEEGRCEDYSQDGDGKSLVANSRFIIICRKEET